VTTTDGRAPLLSVITVCLNSARFLRETLDSVARQTFTDYEHIVVDGGSTDGTQAILAEYPSVRWISEPDGDLGVLSAVHRAVGMARGKYVIQCYVSDGFLDPRWFATAVEYLESRPTCALVWSFPQQMTEDGALQAIYHADILGRLPGSGPAFLPFWLASKFVFPEGNYCTYRTIFADYFPNHGSPAHHLEQPHLGFVFVFMRRGYLSAVLPRVSSYFRLHEGQRSKERLARELPAAWRYQSDVTRLSWRIILGRERYVFRDPHDRELGTLSVGQRARLLVDVMIERVLRIKVLRYPPVYVLRYVWRTATRQGAGSAAS
jgi:glycosyltransferase involved in cell wall biosynthesis